MGLFFKKTDKVQFEHYFGHNVYFIFAFCYVTLMTSYGTYDNMNPNIFTTS
jgi:hypothetical protein